MNVFGLHIIQQSQQQLRPQCSTDAATVFVTTAAAATLPEASTVTITTSRTTAPAAAFTITAAGTIAPAAAVAATDIITTAPAASVIVTTTAGQG